MSRILPEKTKLCWLISGLATADRYPETIEVVDTSDGTPAPANAARLLLIDDSTILMSTLEADASTNTGHVEVDMWTADTGLGRMFIGIIDEAMAETLASGAGEGALLPAYPGTLPGDELDGIRGALS